jgi:hypothetical protein
MGDWKLVIGGNVTDSEESAEPTAKAKKGKGKKKAAGPAVELFDLATDPNEKTNIASANPEKVAELRAKLDTYAAEAVPPKSAPKAAGFKSPRVWGQKE